MRCFASLLLVPTALAACATTPGDPVADIDTEGWTVEIVPPSLSTGAEATPLSKAFGDPVLETLVTEALAGNPDYLAAQSRLREARAIERADLAALGLKVGTSSSVAYDRLSENGTIPVGNIPGVDTERTFYDIGFDASWELDLFGRKAARREIAGGRREVAELGAEDAAKSLRAEVMREYIGYRAAETEAAQRRVSAEDVRQLAEAVRIRRETGTASDTDVANARARLADTEGALPATEAEQRVHLYRLAALTATSPTEIAALLNSGEACVPPAPGIPANLTSDVLRRRSDVRQAESEFMIAAKETDLASLARFPTFSLFGSGGPESIDASTLFEPESLAVRAGLMMNWTLFDSGRTRALLEAAGERETQSALGYRSAALGALSDVDASTARYVEAVRALETAKQSVMERERLLAAAETRAKAGTGARPGILEAGIALAEARARLARAEEQAAVTRIALNKALGL